MKNVSGLVSWLIRSFSRFEDEVIISFVLCFPQATEHIAEMMKSPAAFQEFWSVVVNSSNSDARQAAAMYFYRMVLKKKKWIQLPTDIRCRYLHC